MTVGELIAKLQTMPPQMLVAYQMFSEQCLLEESQLEVVKACMPRPDGWIQSERPDMPSQEYLMFPGN